MRNILTTNNGIATLLSNVDDGTNAIVINGDVIPSTDWTGTGNYTFTNGGVTFTIQKVEDDSGNIMLQLVTGTTYRLVKVRAANLSKAYMIDDPTESTIADGDFFPFYDTSAGEKKKTLWSTIIDKIKSVLGIADSGTTFLRKDGTWATPTNTTYTFATGEANGQIKVTPSGGTAQNVSVKGLGSAAYETADTAATASTVAKRDGSGYLKAVYFNATNTTAQNIASYTSNVVFQSSDGYFRKTSKANFQSWLGLGSNAYTSTEFMPKTGGTFSGNVAVITSNTTTTPAMSRLTLGDDTASGTAGASYGLLRLFSSNTGRIDLRAEGSTADTTIYLPADADWETLTTKEKTVPKAGGTFTGNLNINRSNGTASSDGDSVVIVGNSTGSGTAKNSYGILRLYSLSTSYINLRSQTLTSARSLYLPASGTALATSASSSARVKENIRDMTEEEARKILDIDVVKFDYKEDYEPDLLDQSGVIAEEVLDIIPEVVTLHPMYDETKAIDPASNPSPTVDYGKFAPYLIKMVQIQQQKIEALEQRLAALEN